MLAIPIGLSLALSVPATAIAVGKNARFDLLAWPNLNVTTCEPATWEWTGGTPPYNLTISARASLYDIPDRFFLYESNCTCYTWTVDMPAGYEFNWALTDANSHEIGGSTWVNGDEALIVLGGSTTECIGQRC